MDPRQRIQLPVQEVQVQSLGREDPLETELAAHPSFLALEILWDFHRGAWWAAVHEVEKV